MDVQVWHDPCPACGGELVAERVDFASRTERPELPHPQVTPYRVWVCRGLGGDRQVRGHHPDLAPDQSGATAHRLGPRLMVAAHVLPDGVGMPVRKVPTVLQVLTGVQVTPGALTQHALRQAQHTVGQIYEQLRAAVRAAPVVHTDDTGGRVGGEPAYLMAFETEAATVDQIRPRHRHEEVQEVMPPDYAGVMVTDRGRSYDAQGFERVEPQQCLAHILRSIRDVLVRKFGRARDVGEQLKAPLQDALALGHDYCDGQVTDLKAAAEALQAALTDQLRDRRLKDPDTQRLLHERGWHHDRGHMRRFLANPRIEPTNNRAERALRPAVIAPNVSHGSKNGRGAEACAAFTSVIRTLIQADAGAVVEALSELFRPTQPPHVLT